MSYTIVHNAKSDHGEYQIVDGPYTGRPARVLYGPERTPQSGVALDHNPALLFDYNQRFLEMLQTLMPARVLVIGGGALTFPMAIARQFPDIAIDVVEINPLLPQLAEQFFGFEPTPRVRVTVQDGVQYMQQCTQRYDAIIVDAFVGRDVVSGLFTSAVVRRYRECLAPGGVVAVNFISRYFTRKQTLAHELSATFGEEFAIVELYPADYDEPKRHEQNLVLVASESEKHFEYLQSAVVTLAPPE